MTNGGEDLAAMEHEDAGELPPVGTSSAYTMAREERRAQPRPPDAWMHQSGNRCVVQAELSVQRLVRIADADDVGHAVLREPSIGFFRRRHVHERNLRPGRFDSRPSPRDVGQGFATERSPEMPEKDQEQRRVVRHAPGWFG